MTELSAISPTWVMEDIQYANEFETRTDGNYPNRIGSTFQSIMLFGVGHSVLLEYLKDNLGSPKHGYLHTSPVVDYAAFMNEGYAHIIIKSQNSVFFLRSEYPVQETDEIKKQMYSINITKP